MSRDGFYPVHIVECIQRIQQYIEDGKSNFFVDQKTQDAVIRNLQILAESTQRISDSLKMSHLSVEWSSIPAFRNVAVHNYLGIDLQQIWEIVEEDLPNLKRQIEEILKDLEETL